MLSVHLVARFVAPPGTLLTVIRFGFTVAAVVQGAVWVRVLILGFVMRRATSEDHHTLNAAMGIIRVLVNFVVWSIAAILLLDNVGVNVTGLVAGLGVGGHRHRPRRAGYFRRPVRRAGDPVRSAVPHRRHDQVRRGDGPGRSHRSQDRAHPRGYRRAGDRLERQAARTADSQPAPHRDAHHDDDLSAGSRRARRPAAAGSSDDRGGVRNRRGGPTSTAPT